MTAPGRRASEPEPTAVVPDEPSSRVPVPDAPSPGERPSPFAPLQALRARVRRLPGGTLAWRLGVTVLGLAIIAVGIVLLPLPGPGWLIIFLGLAVWGTEFEWASRLLHWVRGKVGLWTAWVGRRPRWLQSLIGLALFAFVAAVVVGTYLAYRAI